MLLGFVQILLTIRKTTEKKKIKQHSTYKKS